MTSEADEDAARRKNVERVMETYVFINDDRLSMKLNAAVMAKIKSMRFGSGVDLHDWHLTIGAIIARMRRACGVCHPLLGLDRVGCEHIESLERAARLALLITQSRRTADTCDAQLRSATKRRRMSRRHILATETLRSESRRNVEAAIAERRRIIHRSLYSDAIEMFDRACSRERVYCYREI